MNYADKSPFSQASLIRVKLGTGFRSSSDGGESGDRTSPADFTNPESPARLANGTIPESLASPENGSLPENPARPANGAIPERAESPTNATIPNNPGNPADASIPEGPANLPNAMIPESSANLTSPAAVSPAEDSLDIVNIEKSVKVLLERDDLLKVRISTTQMELQHLMLEKEGVVMQLEVGRSLIQELRRLRDRKPVAAATQVKEKSGWRRSIFLLFLVNLIVFAALVAAGLFTFYHGHPGRLF
ncbi:hypothetical protein PQR34_48025 [Paraburkholderia sediminicola]|uniref:hypothetical protein n=1 Tax=Paraburkholderia sediminicola TaxID=458836 RepID=UPI0038B9B072